MSDNLLLSSLTLHLHPDDPLVIARQAIPAGTQLIVDEAAAQRASLPFKSILARQAIPAGHKLALRPLAAGEEVLRYGCRIGVATQTIAPGDWIHSHNLSVGEMGREFSLQVVESAAPGAESGETFAGYPRPNGQAGVRNLIAVVATVSCAAQTARAIAHAFPPEALAAYPNVDGVIAITHTLGCCDPLNSLAHHYLQRALLNLAYHPNIGALIYIGLGCEGNQMGDLVAALHNTAEGQEAHAPVGPYLVIQEQGGIAKTAAAGVEALKALLPQVNAVARQPVPVSRLTVALQCGGSDSWSGVTANPLVGKAADRLVLAGGTAVLAETPEIYGAEQLLTCRVASEAVGQKLIERLRWWQEHSRAAGFSLDNNPSPGNKAGGLTTIFEKSLGAVAKGGSTPLMHVAEYAERITARGLVFMDTPGYDPASVTGQTAGGCNLTIFTTGRGTVYGGSLAPCIKVVSNSAVYRRMEADMDFNAGAILEGVPIEQAAQELWAQVIRVASGERSKSELSGFREIEFLPWHLGGML